MREDPIVAEVRRVRDALWATHNYDVKAMFADMRKRQAALGDRLVTQDTKPLPVADVEASNITESPEPELTANPS